ncbi:30S ribosomal protein S1 [Fundicoccus culcitae]|uniref:30S ribosomal protein S1 n=1 Tax=Fundicoccus culcitae TaxID=2969821 RepID=A0ABY5P9K9_9LACT|nr:30S ribosomal protein S1 [Fundicoccus culcitae]UUX35441.1 30S ribosomal protein S1 [Fundicoccus culcitae]
METMEDALDSVVEIKVGDTVWADVLAFDDKQVRVAIKESGGLEGVIERQELSSTPFEDPSEIVNIGDEIELVVLRPIKDKENGNYYLSKKRVDAKKVWVEIQEKADRGETIEAPVKDVVKGGLVVDAGVRGFVPASMVEDYFVEDFSPYKGKTLEFKIVEIEPSENRLILSHKEIARKEREEKRAEILDNLEEGSIVEGTIARLTNFGAFIDLGGIDGLVHISRIAHEHIDKPSDKLTIGEKVNVKILSVDKDRGRVSLSIKDTLAGPWDNIEERAPEGSVLTGTVKRLTSFGAFVEVFPAVEGLVHISQISHDHIATPHEKLEEGQEIQVKVLSADPQEQRLSLSIKALLDKPVSEEGHTAPESNRRNQSNNNRPRSNKQSNTSSYTSEESNESGFSFADLLGSDELKALRSESDDE